MTKKRQANQNYQLIYYQPSDSYKLDLEIISISSLRKKKNKDFFLKCERVDVYILIFVTENEFLHTVDFELYKCKPGSLIAIQPGQTHRFDPRVNFEGWMVIFRPEFLLPTDSEIIISPQTLSLQLGGFPNHIQLNNDEQEAVMECIHRMQKDITIKADAADLNVLLQTQVLTLLNRLQLSSACGNKKTSLSSTMLQHYNRFRFSVERNFSSWHRVADYANRLGCSEKNLNRVVQELSGITAKTFISNRITLEAKRYLANTDLPICIIADKLGFTETTNFIKFFKREVGCTPGNFRSNQYKAWTKLEGQ